MFHIFFSPTQGHSIQFDLEHIFSFMGGSQKQQSRKSLYFLDGRLSLFQVFFPIETVKPTNSKCLTVVLGRELRATRKKKTGFDQHIVSNVTSQPVAIPQVAIALGRALREFFVELAFAVWPG